MFKNNFYSFIVPNIDHKEYEESLVSSGVFSGNEEVFRNIINHIGLESKKVLDLASGDGTFGRVLRDMGGKWELDALDFSIPEKNDPSSNYKHYNHVYEHDALRFDFSNYDYVISNHFFEHLYINQILDLLEKFRGVNLIISVPTSNTTLAYNRFFLKAVKDVDNVKYYNFLVGAIHKTCFDNNLNKILKLERMSNFSWCQILIKKSDMTEKDKYMAHLYISKTQEQMSHKIINYTTFILLYPARLIRKILF